MYLMSKVKFSIQSLSYKYDTYKNKGLCVIVEHIPKLFTEPYSSDVTSDTQSTVNLFALYLTKTDNNRLDER